MHFTRVLAFSLPATLFSFYAYSESAPLYKDRVLTIPSVSTSEQVGQYQDLIFNYTPQGTWQLSDLKSIGTRIGTAAVNLTWITKVDVIKTDGFPVQVFLRVNGTYESCNSGKFGQINQRMVDNRFDIAITYNSTVSSVPVACLPSLLNFIKTIPLSVYGLNAGTYTYNVNGTTGTFTLAADNKYSGDIQDATGIPLTTP